MNPITVTRNIFPAIRVRHIDHSIYDSTDDTSVIHKNDWGIRSIKPIANESSLVVSQFFDIDILHKLLDKYSIVTTANLEAYDNYTECLRSTVGALIADVRKNANGNESTTFQKYVKELGDRSSFGISKDMKLKEEKHNQMVYFLGTPQVMLSLWNKYTQNSPLIMYVKHEEGIQEISLSDDIAPVCTRYESLQSAGCLACPFKNDCVSELLGEKVSPVAVDLSTLKKFMEKLKVDLIPHSDCVVNRGNERIDISDIWMVGSAERNNASKEKRLSISNNKRFYRENCSNCYLESVCGSSRGYGSSSKGVSSFCTGKISKYTMPEITPNNYIPILEVILNGLCIGSKGSANEELVQLGLTYAKDWVDTGGTVPWHASYFLAKLHKARDKDMAHQEYYLVPRQLIKMAELFNLTGSFDSNYNSWYNHGIGDWFYDSTESITNLIPAKQSSSNWVALLPSGIHIQGKTYYDRSPRHEYADSLVLAKLFGVKYSYKTSKFSTKTARIHLVFEFIKYFLCPYNTYHYGPFGSQRAWLPQGIPGRWTWNWREQKRVQVPSPFSIENTLQNVKDILNRLRYGVSSDDHTRIYKMLQNNNTIKETLLNNG